MIKKKVKQVFKRLFAYSGITITRNEQIKGEKERKKNRQEVLETNKHLNTKSV